MGTTTSPARKAAAAMQGLLGDCHLYVLQGFWAVRQHMVSGLNVAVGPVAPGVATLIAYDLLAVAVREGEGVLMNL